jgi:hypothetical protein
MIRIAMPTIVRRSWPFQRSHGQAVMVVGMHRSGTSFLAGSLQLAGLELGRCSTWNRFNQRGNRENQEVVAFHDGLLARHGCAWHSPPPAAVPWNSAERKAASRIVASFRGVPAWGFKDPRATLFHEGWRALVPDLSFVGIFRHPSAVAESLRSREEMPAADALRIWAAYNRRLLALHEERPFPLLCFDDDEATLHEQLDRVATTLGLRPVGPDRFFTGDLKHHDPVAVSLPPAIADLYDKLRSRQQAWWGASR